MVNFPSEQNGKEDDHLDSDGDGIPDFLDDDDDNDGILDADDEDADGDGIPDDDEIRYFKDIYTEKEKDLNEVDSGIENSPDDDTDSDGDGIPDYLDTDNYQSNGVSDENDDGDDADGDGIPDDDEVKKFKDVLEEDRDDDEIEEGLFGTLGGFFKRKLLSLPPQRAGVLLYLSFCRTQTTHPGLVFCTEILTSIHLFMCVISPLSSFFDYSFDIIRN